MTPRPGPAASVSVIVLGVTLALLPVWPALAGPVSDQFKADLMRVLKTVEESEGKPEAARRAAIRAVAEPVFDWREMSARALALHWQVRTEEERTEFVHLFTYLIERAYISKVERYSGEPVNLVGERIEGSLAVVQTRFITPKGQEVPMDYRLLSKDGRWRVYDVIIEGVSLIANYRTQFDRVIRTSSYAALVERLKNPTPSAPAPTAPRPSS
jgi:phospholipid transport system substrate-binding protein